MPDKRADGGPATILFASDDDGFRTTLRAYLEHVGFRVQSCTDAKRVPELIYRVSRVDLLLCDVHALGGPILRLAAELSDLRPDLPVIILSAPHVESGAFAGLGGRNWKFLSQPAVPDLLGVIDNMLERHQHDAISSISTRGRSKQELHRLRARHGRSPRVTPAATARPLHAGTPKEFCDERTQERTNTFDL